MTASPKIVHVPFGFYPDAVGGTEVYVAAVAREQQLKGYETVIAAPGERDEEYFHDGLRVWRFGVAPRVGDLRELYGDGSASAAQAFARILDHERPDLVHLHAFTRGASLRMVREVKRRGIPVVFSYHTPTASCQRGTLLRWGSGVCDGVLHLNRCTACSLHGQGLSKPASILIGSLPAVVGRCLGNVGVSGGAWTALRMTELLELRHAAFRALMAEVNHVVALCDWVRRLLLRNGVPGEKITVSRQGLCHERSGTAAHSNGGDSLRVAFLGRLDPTKGIHVLVDALARIPTASISLDIYGVVQGVSGREYMSSLRRAAARDPRITFCEPIPAADVTGRLSDYDVLAVPSQSLETGPMVVLEAFAAGIPVLGSNLGGIAELVTYRVDGLLVEASSPAAWSRAFQQLSTDRALLARLQSRVRAPRTIREAASEMLELYNHLAHAPEGVR